MIFLVEYTEVWRELLFHLFLLLLCFDQNYDWNYGVVGSTAAFQIILQSNHPVDFEEYSIPDFLSVHEGTLTI